MTSPINSGLGNRPLEEAQRALDRAREDTDVVPEALVKLLLDPITRA